MHIIIRLFKHMLVSRLISQIHSVHSHALSSPEVNMNLLRQFGIINPIIYRNLTYTCF